MKIRLMMLVNVMCFSMTLLAVQPQTLAEFKTIYEGEAKKIKTSEGIQAVEKQYLKTLTDLETGFRNAGDFPGTKVVIEEKKRFESSRMMPDQNQEGIPVAIADAQKAYRRTYAGVELVMNARLARLTQQYTNALTGYTRLLLKEDKMTLAAEVAEEMRNAEKTLATLNQYLKPAKANGEPIKDAPVKESRGLKKSPMIGQWAAHGPSGNRLTTPLHVIHPDGRFELTGLPEWCGTYKFTNSDKTQLRRTCKNGNFYLLYYDKETDTISQSEGSVFRRVKVADTPAPAMR